MTEPNQIQQPGTLVWVGPTHHPEFANAFQFCRTNAAQIAVRRSPRDLSRRPAGFVKRIIFARVDRSPVGTEQRDSLVSLYGDAEFLALTSSLCDGESRTGTPWSGMGQIRFSRWAERLPSWLGPCGCLPAVMRPARSALLLTDRYETAEPYLDCASSLGLTINWNQNLYTLVNRNLDLVIWDDSVASPASTNQWRLRTGGVGELRSRTHHTWLVTQPHINEIQAAIDGGITDVFTKPVHIHSLF